MRKMLGLAAGMLALAGSAAAAPVPAGRDLTALAGLQPGMWHVRMIGAGQPERDVCIADPRLLMQLRHGDAACEGFVVENQARLATLHYSCPAAGWGRTSLRLGTRGLVHIDSQGIADNAPFAFVAEARRTGGCPAAK